MMQTTADLLPNKAAKTLAGSATGVGRAAEVPPATPRWLAELEGQPDRAPRHLLLQAEQGNQRGKRCPPAPQRPPCSPGPESPGFSHGAAAVPHPGQTKSRALRPGFLRGKRQRAEKKPLPDHPVHSPKAQLLRLSFLTLPTATHPPRPAPKPPGPIHLQGSPVKSTPPPHAGLAPRTSSRTEHPRAV